VVIDDHRARDLERQLGSEERDRRPPHIAPGVAGAAEIQEPAERDRGQRNRGQNPSPMLDKPSHWASTPASIAPAACCRWRGRNGMHVGSLPRAAPSAIGARAPT
jgi:hypothetical protein